VVLDQVVGRPRLAAGDKRHVLNTTVDAALLRWLKAQVGPGKRYRTLAEAADAALRALKGL